MLLVPEVARLPYCNLDFAALRLPCLKLDRCAPYRPLLGMTIFHPGGRERMHGLKHKIPREQGFLLKADEHMDSKSIR
jgi:hypothetical protein